MLAFFENFKQIKLKFDAFVFSCSQFIIYLYIDIATMRLKSKVEIYLDFFVHFNNNDISVSVNEEK